MSVLRKELLHSDERMGIQDRYARRQRDKMVLLVELSVCLSSGACRQCEKEAFVTAANRCPKPKYNRSLAEGCDG